MITADTIKVEVARDAISSHNPDLFDVGSTKKAKDGSVISFEEMAKGRPLGLSRLRVYDEKAHFEFSAKILGSDYYRGITTETVQAVPDMLSRSGDIEVRPAEFFDTAKVFRFDIATNIRPSNLRDAIYAASLGNLNRKWRYSDYGSNRDDGFVFDHRSQNRKVRLSGYDKFREMNSRRKVKHAEELRSDLFDGVLRIETQLTGYQDMRKYLQIGAVGEHISLFDALGSSANPNLSVFDEVIYSVASVADGKMIEIGKLWNSLEEKGMRQTKEIWFMAYIFDLYDGNWPTIEQFVRYGYASNPSREIGKWKRSLATWKLAKQQEDGNALRAIEEVRNLLSAAA